MKTYKPGLVAFALIALIGCGKQTEQQGQSVVLKTEMQKQAYGLGASIGMYLEKNLEAQAKLGLTLEKQLIVKGFIDKLAGKSLIDAGQIASLLTELEQTMQVKQQAQAIEQAAQSLLAGQKYLAENAKKAGVTTTASGIQYSVVKTAQGIRPKATDTVQVHYEGKLLNGDTFDSSYARQAPAVFPLNRVIKGWTEAVQLMPVGSKYRFTIPAELAYGEQGNLPTIPGNAVLQFDIELLAISQPKPAVQVGDH